MTGKRVTRKPTCSDTIEESSSDVTDFRRKHTRHPDTSAGTHVAYPTPTSKMRMSGALARCGTVFFQTVMCPRALA